jgi:UDP-N-acetylglucosamine diphosphorylase / glucose-1-phosphate thymidylyltransferase / UDP-N-acetylgalactosamine diphosphorylase / glucosamine-1-phosphate N-acetyltransferase / galactosamine-1-phosphate N-acetyltransferase
MKQAVILAAGEGQRLRPFTMTRPKVMLSIAGKPILQYVIEALSQNGIRDIIIVVGYRKEQIFDHFGNGERFGVNIVYINQEKQIGTAHALKQVKDSVQDQFMVLNGDNLIDAGTIAGFVDIQPPAILLKQAAHVGRYGVVTLENNIVKSIVEKPTDDRADRINTGTYVFTKEIFNLIGSELDIPAVVNIMLSRGSNIYALETQGTWLDIVYPWDIVKLNGLVLGRIPAKTGGTIESGTVIKGQVSIGQDTVIKANCYIVGPVVIGDNCDIGPNVCILPSTSIGDNVSISPFTIIENSVISDDVNIGSNSLIEYSVIDKGCVMHSHFNACNADTEVQVDNEYHNIKVGAMIGIGCNLGSNLVVEPGTILGNYCQVNSLKVIRGKIPDRARVY